MTQWTSVSGSIWDLVLFESTWPRGSSSHSCKLQIRLSLIDEQNESEFVYVIDISQARARNIRPILQSKQREEVVAQENDLQTLAAPPPLPPVRLNERIVDETPETRIDTWQRRLLDLTKRNSLLSFRDRTSGIRIYCPDIGQMEDQLAEGTTFTFKSAEDSQQMTERPEKPSCCLLQ